MIAILRGAIEMHHLRIGNWKLIRSSRKLESLQGEHIDRVFFFQAEDGIRDLTVTGVQTCALPICPMISATRSARPRSVSNVSVRMRSNGGCRTPASVADSSRLRSCWAKADGSPLALGEARWMRAQRGWIELRTVAVPDGPRTAKATSSGAGCVTRTTRDPTSAVTSRATAASTTLSNDVTRRGILGSRYRRFWIGANAGSGIRDRGSETVCKAFCRRLPDPGSRLPVFRVDRNPLPWTRMTFPT